MDRFDVVIAGAGPAGAIAGYRLAEAGAKVLLLDRKQFPRAKTCGGLLSARACSALAATIGTDASASLVVHRSAGFALCDRLDLLNSAPSEGVFSFTDRTRLDQRLLELAVEKGCKVRLEQPVRHVRPGEVVLDGETLRSDFVIGADGVHSRTRTSMGWTYARDNLAFALQVDLPVQALAHLDQQDWTRIVFGYLRTGWAWVFPKGEHVAVGIGGLDDPGRVRTQFEAFLGAYGLDEAARGIQRKGAWLPYGRPVKEPGRDRVLLVGDAAGLVEPVTGEGLYFAFRSGRMAADAILDDPASADVAYRRRVEHHLHPHIHQARFFRPFLFRRPFLWSTLWLIRHWSPLVRAYSDLLAGRITYLGLLASAVRHSFSGR